MSNIADKVKEIISEQFKNIDITEKMSFADLGGDSLDSIELVMRLESEFGIDISDEEMEKLLTVLNVVNFVVEKTKK